MKKLLKVKLFKFVITGLCTLCLSPLSAQNEFWLVNPTNPKGSGFFSCFNLVLGHLYLYENKRYRNVKGLKIDFGEDGNYYSPEHGSNWWEYYFEPLSLGSQQNALMTPSPFKANQLAWHTRRTLDRAVLSQILHRYVKIKPHILSKVTQFTGTHFSGYMIGIHYRGTDKSSEAPRVPYEKVVKVLLKQIEILGNKPFSIFVATDEQAFLNYMESMFPGQVVATDSTRSEDLSNVHVGSDNPYLVGEEALIDAILLSKCDLLLRTSSSLSLWSTFYNSDLPVILLNKRYGYLPE